MCLGSALDIMEAARPPRATFVDYPLGHTSGKAFDLDDQLGIVREALLGFERSAVPGHIHTLANAWSHDEDWKETAFRPDGEDAREERSETPQFQVEADRSAAVTAGAL